MAVAIRPHAAEAAAPVVVRCRVDRGKPPPPGVIARSFKWRDVLAAPPPRRHGSGGGAYVVYEGSEETETHRIAYSSVIAVDPGEDERSAHDDFIVAESRISVARRPFLELMDRERRFTDRLTSRWRERLARRLVDRRRRAATLRPAWLGAASMAVVRLDARLSMAVIRTTRRLLRGAVRVPDALATRFFDAQAHLTERLGRRAIWRGIGDPESLNAAQKSVVLTLLAAGLVAAVLVLNTVFSLVVPHLAPTYRRMFTDAVLSLLGTLAIPFPAEPALVASVLVLGPVLGFAGLFLGKVAGAWLLYLIGDSLYEAVHVKTATRPRLKRAVDWMNANAARYGFWILIPVNAIPLVPDVLLYVFAISGMPFRSYMAGIAVGTALKFGAIVAAVLIVGPERVQEFLARPFG